jgi:hypothetical protein
MPPEDTMTSWSQKKDYRRPDVVIRTRDWSLLEELLRDRWMEPILEEALRPTVAYR